MLRIAGWMIWRENGHVSSNVFRENTGCRIRIGCSTGFAAGLSLPIESPLGSLSILKPFTYITEGVTMFRLQGGKSIFWLVTSHADEPAYIAAQRFYRLCREQDYNMILKGFTRRSAPEEYDPDYQYTGRSKLQDLSWNFFKYALSEDKSEDDEKFIADYVNGTVFPATEGTWIPKSQAVHLPTKELAEAWGTVEN